MKKFLLLAVLVLLTGFAFAQESDEEIIANPVKPEFFDMEITIGVPIHWTSSPSPHDFANQTDIEDKFVTANTALGVALLFNFTRTFGLTLDSDFFFGSDVGGQSPTSSNANSLFGFNLFLGPVFYLYSGNILRIPLAIGAHLYYWSGDFWTPLSTSAAAGEWFKYTDLQIGPSIYLGLQLHFNESIYITSRTTVALDMFRWHKSVYNDATNTTVETYKHSEFAFGWHVKPAFGVGIKY